MLIYVVLTFSAICIGMFLSVKLFGTGTKRSKIFKEIYYSVEDIEGKGILYTKTGEYSAILRIDNSVQKFCANIDAYYDFSNTFTALMQALGEGYSIHKQDIFTRKGFCDTSGDNHEFLSNSYFDYFKGRPYTDCVTYLTITQENKKSRFLSYDPKKWRDFLVKVQKAHDVLKDRGFAVSYLSKEEAQQYVDRYFAMNFSDKNISMNNFKADDETISMGKRQFKVYSLVDVDNISLPSVVRPYTDIEVNNTSMPVDLMSVISSIPDAINVVYNQVIYLPNQKQEMGKLGKKKNRHSSVPSPGNLIAVEDIKKVEEIVARENKQLIYAHFNLIVTVDGGTDIQKCTNYLENAFSRIGIHMSKRAYNQLELFAGSFPGNCYTLNPEYDRFLTLSSAAACLMYKERIQHSEDTPLKVYYTDRQGVPVAIDISGKEGKTKFTDNSNFFCLGPSGSGKSFHMNSVVRQMYEQGTDIVMVDTGNSYEGLCEYVDGKYISYTDEKPITMNPFRIKKEEYNIEKKDFLRNLILLIWKGQDHAESITEIEKTMLDKVIDEYYNTYFNGDNSYTVQREEQVRKKLERSLSSRNVNSSREQIREDVDALVKRLARQRSMMKVESLSFNSFYDFATVDIEIVCTENGINTINYDEFSTILEVFYKGGIYERILNEDVDTTLFDEKFIVFEVDAIKENAKLFPIVTLIIMDVFLQKMRIKKNRKMLVIEEAWKAIASPMMAEYIRYIIQNYRLLRGIRGRTISR